MPKFIEEMERYRSKTKKKKAKRSKHKHDYFDAIIRYPVGSPGCYSRHTDTFEKGQVCRICGKIYATSLLWFGLAGLDTKGLDVYDCSTGENYVDAWIGE